MRVRSISQIGGRAQGERAEALERRDAGKVPPAMSE
jgi:hypothetical protein